MRVFLTGGTGFIGGQVARLLRERGDDVVALVRSPDRASALRELGCELIAGDLSDTDALRRGAEGADAVIHGAAVYKIGVPKSAREELWNANVHGTERVLDAAAEAGTPRIVYVSTANVFGNTRGQAVDETYERRLEDGFLSVYDETKFRSHQIAKARIAAGAPIVIVQPGGVYGPGDHSEIGNMIEQARTGKLPAKVFPEMGASFVHVEDVAAGILLALDSGEVGEAYILGGDRKRMGDVVDRAARLSGRKPPRWTMPPILIALSAPVGPLIGPLMGFPPNLKEAKSASHDVTYWVRDDKARDRLGYNPRDLETGLQDTLAASS